MLQRRWWIIALIGIGLILIGSAIHNAAWSQGYMMGQLAAGGEGEALIPYASHGFRPGMHTGYSPFGSVLGTVVKIGFLALLAMMAIKFFRFQSWRAAHGGKLPPKGYGPEGEHWAKHWPHHGHMPPWCWGWEHPSEETTPAEAAEAEAEPEG